MNGEMTTDELVRQVSAIADQVGANTCFGTPVERNGHTVIPVARVSFGYGLGFGRGSGGKSEPSVHGDMGEDGGEGEGGGGGGGGGSTPVAVIDISHDDVTITPIIDRTRIALATFTMIAWNAFWVMMTVRTIAHERAKTKRHELDKLHQ